eukprot:GFYU01006629.1.p1 GENE.GFYU01006629.1~~GFYU01006629.1.p1  ORF type:complete len:320 (-),score=62.87 GFYU01006629.1:93-932(-)
MRPGTVLAACVYVALTTLTTVTATSGTTGTAASHVLMTKGLRSSSAGSTSPPPPPSKPPAYTAPSSRAQGLNVGAETRMDEPRIERLQPPDSASQPVVVEEVPVPDASAAAMASAAAASGSAGTLTVVEEQPPPPPEVVPLDVGLDNALKMSNTDAITMIPPKPTWIKHPPPEGKDMPIDMGSGAGPITIEIPKGYQARNFDSKSEDGQSTPSDTAPTPAADTQAAIAAGSDHGATGRMQKNHHIVSADSNPKGHKLGKVVRSKGKVTVRRKKKKKMVI